MKLDKDKKLISGMFDTIAPAYDTLNHMLSLGIDKLWRRKVAKMIATSRANEILDVATGTGDLAITIAQKNPNATVIGVDFSKGMLTVGVNKVKNKGLLKRVTLQYGDALNLEFKEECFNAVTVGFGVRNFSDLKKGLSEMCRVLKKDSYLYVIELSMPKNRVIKFGYNLYFKKILPIIGKFRSKDDFAYKYLPESVSQFLESDEFCLLLKESGFKSVKTVSLTFGVATLYIAKK